MNRELRSRTQLLLAAVLLWAPGSTSAQSAVAPPDTVQQQMRALSDALTRTEAELTATQREMLTLHQQMIELQRELATSHQASDAGSSSSGQQSDAIARRLAEVEEQQSVVSAQVATHDQSKVESESKYPVRISGMVLMNSFVNTAAVDNPATPTFAAYGSGSTGISLRQTLLGLDARGPHLFGASSSADVRTDFAGTSQSGGYSGGIQLVRLRTAHASLAWQHATAFFSLDRTILNPNAPTSLTAVAEPALAWSGNLWSWNPQLGLSGDLALFGTHRVRAQAALMETEDPPAFAGSTVAQTGIVQPNASERSRWPGLEARVAIADGGEDHGHEVGIGGYFSPHRLRNGYGSNSWAVTTDYRLSFPAHLRWSGSVYRGQGIGGLGGGIYKDYLFRTENGESYVQWLDDVGGWTQINQKITQRLEWNAGLGLDNAFSHEIRPFITPDSPAYLGLAKNRTVTANVIFSPSAYLLLSLEYRNIRSTDVSSPASVANVIGAAAGYRF